MPFIVVYDANSLVGNSQRDLLFQVAGGRPAAGPAGTSPATTRRPTPGSPAGLGIDTCGPARARRSLEVIPAHSC
jgi:hypothetical protein